MAELIDEKQLELARRMVTEPYDGATTMLSQLIGHVEAQSEEIAKLEASAAEVKHLAIVLVRNYRRYEGLSQWVTIDEIEVADAERIADAIENLPAMPELHEG